MLMLIPNLYGLEIETLSTENTSRTKLKLDKGAGGGGCILIVYHYIPNCIPLCLNRKLNRKFGRLYRGAAHNTPTSNSELLKLQLGLIRISDIEWVKQKDPLLDSFHFFEG